MVKRLIRHWTLYSRTNSTDINVANIDWKEFLKNNTDFIHPFDYVKDMAVEDPGDSPIIAATFRQEIFAFFASCTVPVTCTIQ